MSTPLSTASTRRTASSPPRRCTAQRTRPCSPRCSSGSRAGAVGETSAPLAGKAALVLLAGASHHHFLATERLRAPLASFFAAQTLSPGLYFTPASYTPDKVLDDESRALTELHGRAPVELATAVRGGAALSRLTPMI